eukprot:2544462-Prymnesium_polylepis.1
MTWRLRCAHALSRRSRAVPRSSASCCTRRTVCSTPRRRSPPSWRLRSRRAHGFRSTRCGCRSVSAGTAAGSSAAAAHATCVPHAACARSSTRSAAARRPPRKSRRRRPPLSLLRGVDYPRHLSIVQAPDMSCSRCPGCGRVKASCQTKGGNTVTRPEG